MSFNSPLPFPGCCLADCSPENPGQFRPLINSFDLRVHWPADSLQVADAIVGTMRQDALISPVPDCGTAGFRDSQRVSKFNPFSGIRRLEYRQRRLKAAHGVHGRDEWRRNASRNIAEMLDLERKRIGRFRIDVL